MRLRWKIPFPSHFTRPLHAANTPVWHENLPIRSRRTMAAAETRHATRTGLFTQSRPRKRTWSHATPRERLEIRTAPDSAKNAHCLERAEKNLTARPRTDARRSTFQSAVDNRAHGDIGSSIDASFFCCSPSDQTKAAFSVPLARRPGEKRKSGTKELHNNNEGGAGRPSVSSVAHAARKREKPPENARCYHKAGDVLPDRAPPGRGAATGADRSSRNGPRHRPAHFSLSVCRPARRLLRNLPSNRRDIRP